MGRSTKQLENKTNGMTEGMDNERVLTPGKCTKEEKKLYEELLSVTKSSLINLVTAVKEIKDKKLYVTVCGIDDDEFGWKLWLQRHCPIQPKLAQFYLTVTEEFENVAAVEYARTHATEIQQLIKYKYDAVAEGKIVDIVYDRNKNKFYIKTTTIIKDADGEIIDEKKSKVTLDEYIDSIVQKNLAEQKAALMLKEGKTPDGTEMSESELITLRINQLHDSIESIRASVTSQINQLIRTSNKIQSDAETLKNDKNINSDGLKLLDQDLMLLKIKSLLSELENARKMILANFPGLRVTSRTSVTDSEDNNDFSQKSEKSAENFLQDHLAHVIQVDHNNIPVNVELTPEQIQIVQDYNKKFLKCVRDYGNEVAGYEHTAGSVIYVAHFNISEKEDKPGEYDIYPLVYINGNVQIFEMDLKDLQENFEVITEVKEFKKARKMFAFVKE